jgi:hypothetical protein
VVEELSGVQVAVHKRQVLFRSTAVLERFNANALREVAERNADAAARGPVESVQDVEAAGDSRVVLHGEAVSDELKECGLTSVGALAVHVHGEVVGLVDDEEVLAFVQHFQLFSGRVGAVGRLCDDVFERVLRPVPFHVFQVVYVRQQHFRGNAAHFFNLFYCFIAIFFVNSKLHFSQIIITSHEKSKIIKNSLKDFFSLKEKTTRGKIKKNLKEPLKTIKKFLW